MLRGSRLIKEWREAKGLTQPQFGRLIGASAAGVCDWENGRAPKVITALRIEQVTGVPVGAWAIEESEALGAA
jgi:transcriptional regulator with XRE-family HTH domain